MNLPVLASRAALRSCAAHSALDTASQDSSLLRCDGRVAADPCTFLFDTGCDATLVDADWAREHCVGRIVPLSTPVQAVCLNNTRTELKQAVVSQIALRGLNLAATHMVMMPGVAASMGAEVVLGMDWMRAHHAVIDTRVARVVFEVPAKGPVKQPAQLSVTCAAAQQVQAPARLAALRALRDAPEAAFVSASAMKRLLRKQAEAFVVHVHMHRNTAVSAGAAVAAAAPSGADAASVPRALTPEQVQPVLDKHSRVFRALEGLPPERPIAHTIPLLPHAHPPFRAPKRLTAEERAVVHETVQKLLEKGWIEPSNSPYGSPVALAMKKDGSWRVCVNYTAVNQLTVRDRFPLPRIDDLLDRVGTNCVFSRLDLDSAYHQVLIPPEDRPKTAFVTDEGHYQYKVLPFGLTNAPATFQRLMQSVLAPIMRGTLPPAFLPDGTPVSRPTLCVYLDDILLMSRTPEEHLVHLDQLLSLLEQHDLRCKLAKCEFGVREVKFLGHVVRDGTITVDPDKIAVLRACDPPRTLEGLRRFLGLANYFKRFIPAYAHITSPLTDLLSPKRACVFPWADWPAEHLQAFARLKEALTAPEVMLHLPDLSAPFTVFADASDLATGAVLLQNGRPVAFCGHKFVGAELNWGPGEKELFALIHACKEWRCYLEGSQAVELLTDHNPLSFFKTQRTLSCKQERWAEFLSRFHFTITYIPGPQNIADPLSRLPVRLGAVVTRARSQRLGGEEPQARAAPPAQHPAHPPSRSDKRKRVHFADEAPVPAAAPVPEGPAAAPVAVPVAPAPPVAAPPAPDVFEAIRAAYARDPAFQDVRSPQFLDLHYRHHDGCWWRGEQVVVPSDAELRARIISEYHTPPFVAHRGQHTTFELVRRTFWWPTLRADVTAFVKGCDECQRNKPQNQAPAGVPQALPIPNQPWESISVDFIVKLPTSGGFDSICVFVDRLTKYVELVPCNEKGLEAKHLRASSWTGCSAVTAFPSPSSPTGAPSLPVSTGPPSARTFVLGPTGATLCSAS